MYNTLFIVFITILLISSVQCNVEIENKSDTCNSTNSSSSSWTLSSMPLFDYFSKNASNSSSWTLPSMPSFDYFLNNASNSSFDYFSNSSFFRLPEIHMDDMYNLKDAAKSYVGAKFFEAIHDNKLLKDFGFNIKVFEDIFQLIPTLLSKLLYVVILLVTLLFGINKGIALFFFVQFINIFGFAKFLKVMVLLERIVTSITIFTISYPYIVVLFVIFNYWFDPKTKILKMVKKSLGIQIAKEPLIIDNDLLLSIIKDNNKKIR